MDTLSYLIQHNNQVRVDDKLVKEYEKDQDQGTLRRFKKSNDKFDKPPSPQPFTRPRQLKAYTRVSPGSSSGGAPTSHSPKLVRPVTRNNIQKPPRNQPINDAPVHQLPERELITLLTSRIETLRDSQHQTEQKFNDSIQHLKSELIHCNQQYEKQCRQFDLIRVELNGTKKDIASLINLVQKNKNMGVSEEVPQEREHPKPPQNKTQIGGASSPRSVLNNFIKVGPTPRQ